LIEEQQNQKTERLSGQHFDTSLYVIGGITGEPERYLADKPPRRLTQCYIYEINKNLPVKNAQRPCLGRENDFEEENGY